MFNPENAFEASLVKARSEPSYREQFYRDFLASEIYVIPSEDPRGVLDGAGTPGNKAALQHCQTNGKEYVPFFSSLSRLQNAVGAGSKSVKLGVRPFLELTKGSALLLNPGNDFGKEFSPEETSRLLDGSIFESAGTHQVAAGTQIFLGEPAKYPDALVKALHQLYDKSGKVRAAYLAQFFDPSHDQEPGLLIALVISGDWDSVAQESGACAQGLTPEHAHVDFVELEKSGVQDYFAKVKPFYKQSLFRRLL